MSQHQNVDNGNRQVGNLGSAILDALKASGKSASDIVAPPKNAMQKVNEYDVTWNQELLGTLKLSVDGYNLVYSNGEIEGHSYSQISVPDRPTHINVQMIAELKPGVRLWHVSNGAEMRNCTTGNIPVFQVPVTWNAPGSGFEDGAWVPHTRRKDIDNIDLILEDRSGRFIEVQVSITTRNGKFYLNLQEVYAGHNVRTTTAVAKRLGKVYHKIDEKRVAIVVPLFEHNAYPGADYLKTWNAIGVKLITECLKEGRSVCLSDATYAEWQQPAFPEPRKKGNLTGIVTFFNVVIGYGFILGSDGKNYFLHFKNLDQEYLPVPMEFYEFHPGMDNGKPKAYHAKRIR